MSGLQKLFFSSFRLHPGHKNKMEGIDSPVYGEFNGANWILVED